MEGLKIEFENIEENKKNLKSYEICKRGIDIIGAGSGLLLLSPIIAIVACAVKFTSKGPIFFSQKRVGKNGQLFDMYKFRSMVVNAEELKEKLAHQNEMSGPMFKMKDDPRVTSYWQVSGRNNIDFEDWMKLDISYVEDRNLWIDIKLIFKTVGVLFGDKNAH